METCFVDSHERTFEYCHHSLTAVRPPLLGSCTTQTSRYALSLRESVTCQLMFLPQPHK